jgi:hypothetical protein
LNEGAPTKKTPEVVAKIAHAISLGLTDEEAAGYAGISDMTLTTWRKDPTFLGKIKDAVATRLVLRLSRIESGVDGWQGSAWLAERLMPSRYSRPEVQLNLIQQNNTTMNALSITISAEEVKQIESQAASERERVKEMFSRYRASEDSYGNGGHIVDVQAEATKPSEAETDEAVHERVRQKFAQYRPEQPAAQPPIVRKEGEEREAGFWDQFVSGDPQRTVEYRTAIYVAKEIVRLCLGPKAAQPVSFDPGSVCVSDVLAEIQRLSGPMGYQLLLRKSGYEAHSP